MASIKDIKVWPIKKEGLKIKANGSFIYDDTFQIKFSLFTGPKGLFVSFPGKFGEKTDDKTGKKIFYPDVKCVNDNLRTELNAMVISAYNEATGNTGSSMDQGEAPGPTDQTKGGKIPF